MSGHLPFERCCKTGWIFEWSLVCGAWWWIVLGSGQVLVFHWCFLFPEQEDEDQTGLLLLEDKDEEEAKESEDEGGMRQEPQAEKKAAWVDEDDELEEEWVFHNKTCFRLKAGNQRWLWWVKTCVMMLRCWCVSGWTWSTVSVETWWKARQSPPWPNRNCSRGWGSSEYARTQMHTHTPINTPGRVLRVFQVPEGDGRNAIMGGEQRPEEEEEEEER